MTFIPHSPYQLQNKAYAEELVIDTLVRMRDVNLFGNGFPLLTVPTPKVAFADNVTLFNSGGTGKGNRKDEEKPQSKGKAQKASTLDDRKIENLQ